MLSRFDFFFKLETDHFISGWGGGGGVRGGADYFQQLKLDFFTDIVKECFCYTIAYNCYSALYTCLTSVSSNKNISDQHS